MAADDVASEKAGLNVAEEEGALPGSPVATGSDIESLVPFEERVGKNGQKLKRAQTMKLEERKSVNSYDLDRVRSSSFGERATSTREALMASTYKTASQAFDFLDVDMSGTLEYDEVARLGVELGINMSEKEIRKSFQEMDKDGDGLVTRSEFQRWWNTTKENDRRMVRRTIREAFERLDKNKDGAITKKEFSEMLRAKKTRRQMMLMESIGGDAFDVDADWDLITCENKDVESAVMGGESPSPMAGSQKYNIQDDRTKRLHRSATKHLDDDERRLKEKLQRERVVTFTEFEKWWKKRMGIDDGDIPVLPEYMAKMINQLSMDPTQLAMAARRMRNVNEAGEIKRTPKDNWDFLRPRLKLLISMQHQWGNIHDLYESHTMSYYEDIPLPPWIRDPDSPFSCAWDIVQLVALLYVSVTVPLRVCYEIEVEFGSFGFVVDNVIDLYFICDLFLNFRTAYHYKNGEREDRVSKIVEHYLKGWFPIDLVACLPVQYIEYAMESDSPADSTNSAGGKLRAAKMLRLVRMTKMLRLAKMKKMLDKYQDSTAEFLQYMGIYVLVAIIIFVAHMMSCFFYMAGDGDSDCNWQGTDDDENDCDGGKLQGWVQRVFGPMASCSSWVNPMYPNKTIIDPTLVCTEVPVSTRYITSLYFVFNALEPHFATGTEKGFAVMAEFAMAAIYGALAGVMSTILMGMRGNEQESQNRLRSLRQWMVEKKMDKGMQQRISVYFNQLWSARSMFDEGEVMSQMPPSMSAEVSTYIYGAFLRTIPLFRGLGNEIIFRLCLVVKPMLALKLQVIIEEGQPGTEMYLLMHGEVEVTKQGETFGFLSEGSFFGEIPVLSESNEPGSEIRSRTVRAVTECELCYLTRDAIRELQQAYPELDQRMKKFSEIGVSERGFGKNTIVKGIRTVSNAKGIAKGQKAKVQLRTREQKLEYNRQELLRNSEEEALLYAQNRGNMAANRAAATGGGGGGSDPALAARLGKLEEMMAQQASTFEQYRASQDSKLEALLTAVLSKSEDAKKTE